MARNWKNGSANLIALLICFSGFTQDSTYVHVKSGTYVYVNGTDSVLIITPARTDTIFTSEIIIVQSNNNSAVIKKKVKWIKWRGSYYVDNYGARVEVLFMKSEDGAWLKML